MTDTYDGTGGGATGAGTLETLNASRALRGQPPIALADYEGHITGPAYATMDPDAQAWGAGTLYPARAAVRHADALWVAAQATQGTEPGTNAAVWMLQLDGVNPQAIYDEAQIIADAGVAAAAAQTALAQGSAAAAQTAQSGAVAARVAAEVARDAAAAAAAEAQSSALTCATWALLSGLTGATAGTGAEVLDADTGTHTDPVVGGTVANAGRYSWSASPAGWRRIGDTGLTAKADAVALAAVSESIGMARPEHGSAGGLLGSDGRWMLRLLWDRARGVNRVDGHALSADIGASAAADRGVLALMRSFDGRALTRLLWDRIQQAPRWEGHALQADIGGIIPAERGVLAALIGADRRALARLLWDRTAEAPRWEGHALQADLDGLGNTPGVPVAGDSRRVAPGSIRATAASVIAQTAASGIGWTRLPQAPTPHVIVGNASGTTVHLRRSWGLKLVGLALRGSFAPGAVASLVDRGAFTTVLPAPGGYAEGDYLEQSASAGNTVSGTVYAQGDLAVLSGGAWVKQACPAGAVAPGDFWEVSGAGTFAGLVLAAGDRLVQITRQVGAGVYRRRWVLADADLGDICLMGETATPEASPPVSPQNGDLWQVTATDGAYADGDGLLRRAGAWLRLPGEPVTAIATGTSAFVLPPSGDAADYEVRRADKSTTQVAVTCGILRETAPVGTVTRDLWLVSDSMFATSTTAIGNAMPDRAVTVQADGGATSYIVWANIQRVLRDGDAYRDRVAAVWHGQNNQGLYSQINEVNDRLAAAMAGRRYLLFSVLGQWAATYGSGRIQVIQQEYQLTQPAYQTYRVIDHLRRAHPEHVFDVRAELCAAADETPALLHPGMTEADVAETYGIVPLSYFMDLSAMPWVPGALVFQGYRSAAGLPTGGADGDYYIRSVVDGANPVGQLLINEGGAWVARQIGDITHITAPAGQAALAERIMLKLQEKGW